MFRAAVFSDVHGNPIALEAVLEDIQRQGAIDQFWVLGDMAALGHDPVGAVQRLTALETASFVRGNTDRHVVEGLPHAAIRAELDARPDRFAEHIDTIAGFSWTAGALDAAGRMSWLEALPLEWRVQLPNGTRVLCVHASPGEDDGTGIHPALSDAELVGLIAEAEADLVLTGHTHWPMDRTVGGVRAVNVGSVSNPMTPGLRASYVLIEATAGSFTLAHHQVEYDRDAVLAELAASRCPSAAYVASFMRGERKPHWMRAPVAG